MLQAIGAVLVGLLVLALLTALGFAGGLINLNSYAFFAPRYAAVDNRVFHNTQQYTDGMAQRLENLHEAYVDGDDAHKALIRSTIRHDFAQFPEDELPPESRSFLEQMRGY